MILFFGPAGSGKTSQAQLLATSMGWRWLSAGQLLRDTGDPELLKEMQTGGLVSHEAVTGVMAKALAASHDVEHVILDGFPRQVEQAKWLVDSRPQHGRSINLVVVLDVPRDEVMQRLSGRGRVDDTPEAVDARLEIYKEEIAPILEYFAEQAIPIVHIDGMGTIEEVQQRIMDAVKQQGLAA